MDHLELPNIQKNGWEFLKSKQKTVRTLKKGDLVKITVAAANPEDTDEPIRSVTHHPLWVAVDKKEKDGYVGILKSTPQHRLELKDGTEFKIGEKIFFRKEHIVSVRGL